MTDVVRKIYVDAPVFTREDEEQFRYVNTDVDAELTRRTDGHELDDVINDALGPPPPPVSKPSRGSSHHSQQHQFSPRPVDSLDDETLRHVARTGELQGALLDPARYEDVEKTASRRAFHGTQQPPERVLLRDPSLRPVNEPDRRVMQQQQQQDEAEEYAEARLERQRHHRQARQAHVPQLDLIESEDEGHENRAVAYDLELGEGRIVNSHHTNHGSNEQNFHHQNGYGQQQQQQQQQHHYHQQQQQQQPQQQQVNDSRYYRGHPANRPPYADGQSGTLYNPMYDDAYVQDSLEVARRHPQLGNDDGNPSYAQTLNRGSSGNWDSRNAAPARNSADLQHANEIYDDSNQQQASRNHPNVADGQARMPVRQHQLQNADGYDPRYTQYNAAGSTPPGRLQPVYRPPPVVGNGHFDPSGQPAFSSVDESRQPAGIHNQRVADHASVHNMTPDMQSERTASQRYQGPDFVETNKVNVRKPPKTYGQIHMQKKGKENVDNHEMQRATRRKSESDSFRGSQMGADVQVRRDDSRMQSQQSLLPESGAHSQMSDASSAELLWKSRAKALAVKKDSGESSNSSAGSKAKRRDAVPPLNKYPSDAHMELSSADSQSYGGTSSATFQRPAVQQNPVVPPIPQPQPQKVSVDINLNVISPRAALNHPSSSVHFSTGNAVAESQNYHAAYPPPPGAQLPAAANPQPFFVVQNPGIMSPTGVYSNPPLSGGIVYAVAAQPQPMGPYVLPPEQLQTYLPVRYSYNYPQSPTGPQQQQTYVYPYQQQNGQVPNVGLPVADHQPRMQAVSSPPLSSHYKVLPPVGNSPKDDQTMNRDYAAPKAASAGAGSYMEQYRRMKKRSDYKAYTIDDYRKLKKEMKLNLGSLGPDMDNDTLKERKDKVQRQQEYAKNVMERNKLEHISRPAKSTRADSGQELSSEEQLNRRQAALDYARHIPKPKLVPRSADSVKTASNTSDSVATSGGSKTIDLDELNRLRERHQWERQQVAMLLQNNGY